MMSCTNTKSRPERSFVFDDEYNKRRKSNWKPRKRRSPKPKATKYVVGQYIYDTKGQMAEIKYIGECHKGSGTWYGIQFVDGSLGKHNGTIDGRTYFNGADRRCDMIRGNKIRNRASPSFSLSTKANKPMNRKARHKRATSDLSCMESYGHKAKHKANAVNDFYFGCKSREEKVIHRGKTVKKEKYKGNKYILAMEQETEKRKHQRIGFIKMDKERIKQEKHERNSSKVQQILKRKELKKEQISKLNKQNKLKELKRIHAAKQKSKRRLNRPRSSSDHTNIRSKQATAHTNTVKKCKLSMVSLDHVTRLQQLLDQPTLPIHSITSATPKRLKKNRTPASLSTVSHDLLDGALHEYEGEIECAEHETNWIKKYSKMNTSNENLVPNKAEAIGISKSVSFVHDTKKTSPRERGQDDMYYGSLSNKKRSVSLSTCTMKQRDAAPIITNDDKGTEYWIQQYNKANKTKRGSKRKSKSSNKRGRSLRMLSIVNPRICETLEANHGDISPPNAFIRDDVSDVPSSVFSDPSPSVVSFDSVQTIVSSLSTSPSNSDESTPKAPNHELYRTYLDDDKEMNQTQYVKYGGYPFKRKRETYINRKFTGIVRIGHRYLLRDGRVGVVRFLNTTDFAHGSWIGIELDNAEGEHNGTVHNTKYFECGSMYGTFVKKSQIAQYMNRDTTRSLSIHQLKYLNASK